MKLDSGSIGLRGKIVPSFQDFYSELLICKLSGESSPSERFFKIPG